MLSGQLKVKIKGIEYKLDLQAIDTVDSMVVRMDVNSIELQNFLGVDGDYTLVKVSPLTTKVLGDRKKLNLEFFKGFSAVIREMKKISKTQNLVTQDDASKYYKEQIEVGSEKVDITTQVVIGGVIVEGKFGDELEKVFFELHTVEGEVSDSEIRLFNYPQGVKTASIKGLVGHIALLYNDLEEQKVKVEKKIEAQSLEQMYYKTFAEVMLAHPDKDLAYLSEQNYILVDDSNFEAVVEYLYKFDLWAFDTETTGLKINVNSRKGQSEYADTMVGFVIAVKEHEAFYFPTGHSKAPNLFNGDDVKTMSYFKEGLETKKVLAYNATFDWKVAYIYGINTNFVMDIQAAFKLTYEAKSNIKNASLKSTTTEYLGLDTLELSDLVVGDYNFKNSNVTFADVPLELITKYACPDGDMLIRLYNWLVNDRTLAKFEAEYVVTLESKFAVVVGYSEFYGLQFDVSRVDELSKSVEEQINAMYSKLTDIVVSMGFGDYIQAQKEQKLNIDSAPQMTKLVYDPQYMGLPVKRGKTGNPSLDAAALKSLSNELPEDSLEAEFIRVLQELRNSNQLKKNFTSKIGEFLDPDGRVYATVNQYLATGRVSVKQPNYQSFNDVVKKYVVAKDGYYIADSDYSSVEYRIIASMSGQEELVKAFDDPEMDYHRLQAANVNEVDYDLVTSKMRKAAKSINFGLAYGMSDIGLAGSLYGDDSPENVEKAKQARARYFEKQPKVEKFFQGAVDFGRMNGYTATFFNRRRYKKPNQLQSSFDRAGGNHRIQGTAADIYKVSMVRLFLYLVENDMLGKIYINAFVHDEVVLEVHKSIDPIGVLRILKACMELKLKGFCPLYIGFGVGSSWYQAKSEEVPVKLQQEWLDAGQVLQGWGVDSFDESFKRIGVEIEAFYMREILSYLQNKDNNGKVLGTVVSGYLQDFLFSKEFKELDKSVLEVYKEKNEIDEANSVLVDFAGFVIGVQQGQEITELALQSLLSEWIVVSNGSDVESAEKESSCVECTNTSTFSLEKQSLLNLGYYIKPEDSTLYILLPQDSDGKSQYADKHIDILKRGLLSKRVADNGYNVVMVYHCNGEFTKKDIGIQVCSSGLQFLQSVVQRIKMEVV